MPVTNKEQTKPCEMTLDIEVEVEKVQKAFDQSYKEIGKSVQVPGFRKGKAPRAVLERYLSEERIISEVAEKLVQPAFVEALEETEIQPYGDAEYETVKLVEGEPAVFKAKIPLPPTVELGEIKGIEVEKMVRKIAKADVDKEIDNFRARSAKVEVVEGRPVKDGDLVVIDVVDTDGEVRETAVEAGKNLSSFDKGLIGTSIDETKSIELEYPEDYYEKELAGTKTTTTITVKSIKERQLPELTDEWVVEMTKGSPEELSTVKELKSKIKKTMEESAEELATREVEAKIVEKLVETSTINYPDVVMDHEISHRMQSLLNELKQRHMTFEDYLENTGRTFEQLRGQMETAAEQDIKASIVLGEIAKKENMEVSKEELEAEIEKMAKESGLPKESVEAYLDKTNGKNAIENRLLRTKVLDFLVKASNIK